MSAAQPVRAGTADQLARLVHFRELQTCQAEELDAIAFWIIGDVGGYEERRALWERVHDDCDRLWHLISDDWTESDLDELTFDQCTRLPLCAPESQVEELRHESTVARLSFEIEKEIWLARVEAAHAQHARTVGARA